MGFSQEQLLPSLVVDKIGNPYTASSLLGLAAVLDIAKPNDRVFMVSYGSGAGSDAFAFEVTGNILKHKQEYSVSAFVENKKYIPYTQYLRLGKKI